MAPRTLSLSILSFVILLFAYMSFYTVNEGQVALVMALGKIKTDSANQAKIDNPGLHFAWPLLNQVLFFDTRVQTFDVAVASLMTAEKKYLSVDYFVRWHIVDPALYYKRTNGSMNEARTLIKQLAENALRVEFGQHASSALISDDREVVMQNLQKRASSGAAEIGISVDSIRVKSIELPDSAVEKVYARMRSEREQTITKLLADGDAQARIIASTVEAERQVTLANANLTAAKLRAEADGNAAKIYSDAFNQDPEFFSFLKSLSAYNNIFDQDAHNNILVLKPDNQFFKYFNHSQSGSKAG